MMRVLLMLIFLQGAVHMMAQPNTGDSWGTLSMVEFENKYDESLGYEVQIPKVHTVVKMLEGQEIEISGYIIPLEGKIKQSHFMLSLYPYAMCFFCGKAGPETAMQIFMDDGKKVQFSEDKITLKGILRINETDINSLLYTLESAKLL